MSSQKSHRDSWVALIAAGPGKLFDAVLLSHPGKYKRQVADLVINEEEMWWKASAEDEKQWPLFGNRDGNVGERDVVVGIFDLSRPAVLELFMDLITTVTRDVIRQRELDAMSPVQKYEGG